MRRTLAVPILLFALVSAAACSKPSNNGIASANGTAAATASPSASNDLQSFANFAKCMREHGQNVPDPDPNSGKIAIGPPAGTDNRAWKDAEQACRHFLPGGGAGEGAPDAHELEKLRAFAVCMRAHAIEMSDPLPTGNMTILGRLEHVTRTQLNNDPGYKAALEACKDKLPPDPKQRDGA
jgi:hypothetical protein